MEKLSNEDKKELFMGLVNQYTNRFDLTAYKQQKGDAMYEAGYWDKWKIKNNGILGLHYDGMTKEGIKQVSLTIGGGLDECYSGIRGGNLTKKFENDEQLNEFLDEFFEMNNMEAINEFSPNAKYFQEDEQYEGCFPNDIPLEYLYLLDCLNEELGENLTYRGVHNSEFYVGEKDSNTKIEAILDYDVICLELSKKIDEHNYENVSAEFNCENFESSKVEIVGEEIPEFDRFVNIFKKSITDFPQVYQELRKGTYDKEKLLKLKSPLQQKESELSTLEAEEQVISKAETLINKQTEKQGQDIGE